MFWIRVSRGGDMHLCCFALWVHALHRGNNAALWLPAGWLSAAETGLPLLRLFPAHPCRLASALLFSHVLAEQQQMALNHAF